MTSATRLASLSLISVVMILGGPASAVTVFDDSLRVGVEYVPFTGTDPSLVTVDATTAFEGLASLRVQVPALGESYVGGVLVSDLPLDLSSCNALIFHVRTDAEGARLNVAGFGNDNDGRALYQATRSTIPLTGEWTRCVVPIPAPSRMTAERGLFLFAGSAEEFHPGGFDVWFDEIEFTEVADLELLATQWVGSSSFTRRYFTGMTVSCGGAVSLFSSAGLNLRVDHSPHYYDIVSSAPGVAFVSESGELEIVGVGMATITGSLQGMAARGVISLAGYEPPLSGPAAPTLPSEAVISLFSDVYDDRPVDTWKADWYGVTTVYEEYAVGGDNAKLYYNMNYFGIEFLSSPVSIAQMTHVHLDVYAMAGTQLNVKLQSLTHWGAELDTVVYLGADSTPVFQPGGWSSLELPLSDFRLPPEVGGGVPPEGWAQMPVIRLILGASPDVQLILVDNVYFADTDAVPTRVTGMGGFKRRYR